MTVYVDPARNPYRGMIMCHCWASRIEDGRYVVALDELLAMADRIGVQRRWLQQPPKASWVHFDIALSKRVLAVKAGAIETDRYGPTEHVARLNGDQAMMERVARLRERR